VGCLLLACSSKQETTITDNRRYLMSDLGFTHVALPVSNVDASIAFYSKYARMQVVHRRTDLTSKSDVVWLSDLTRPFVIVLIQMPTVDKHILG
jgi:hypothetical protein